MTAITPATGHPGGSVRRRATGLLPLVDRSLTERTEAELIAHVLAGPEPGPDARDCGLRLARIPGWQRRAMGADGLVNAFGVSIERAVRLAALWELAERWCDDGRPSITSPRDALLLLEGIRLAGREQVAVIMLDARHRPIGTEVVAVGTLNASRLLPRDVLGPPLRAGAAAVVVGHNHPSGDPAPSRADRMVTAALRSGGQLLGIPVLDHLIVARLGHHSFREAEGWDGEAPAGAGLVASS